MRDKRLYTHVRNATALSAIPSTTHLYCLLFSTATSFRIRTVDPGGTRLRHPIRAATDPSKSTADRTDTAAVVSDTTGETSTNHGVGCETKTVLQYPFLAHVKCETCLKFDYCCINSAAADTETSEYRRSRIGSSTPFMLARTPT